MDTHIELDRDTLGGILTEGLATAGFDAYGNPQGDWYKRNEIPSDWPEHTTNTGHLLIHPYYEDDDSGKPNIYDTETGVCIWWYKCCPREISSNKELNRRQIRMTMLRLREDAQKAEAVPYNADKEFQEDMKIWQDEKELNTELSLYGSFDVSEKYKDLLKRKIEKYGSLRKAQTIAELAWAIRLDPQTQDGKLPIEIHTNGSVSRRKLIKTSVETKDNQIIVQREITSLSQQPYGYTIVFNGTIEAFNKTSWALLLAERIGHDIPTLENLGSTMPEIEADINHTKINDIVMCDISRPNDMSLKPQQIAGTTRINIELLPNDGEMKLTIDAGTPNETSATFYMNDIRKAILLSNMAACDEFSIWIDKNDDYANIELADTTIGTNMADCWERMEKEQKGTNQ